jgi:hypothetical protein
VSAATATPAPEPTPTPVLMTEYSDYGFRVGLERGADVRTAGTPSEEQGVITFAYGDVNTIMTWTPQGDAGSLALVSGTYDLLTGNQPELTFERLIDGEMVAGGEPGVFLGFKAVDGSGDASGGLIGSWTCRVSDTSFTLTLTGTDTAVVQVRFDELVDNFACSSS